MLVNEGVKLTKESGLEIFLKAVSKDEIVDQ